MTKSVFLLGFMGSGKSYWGRRLSSTLELPFYDLDQHIVMQTGKSVPELFSELGETGFRDLERTFLLEMLDMPPCIVSTGGGTPCFFDNMEQMNRKSRTIYLDIPVDILAKRLSKEMQRRPLLANLSPDELPLFIENLLEKRTPFYEKAHQKPEWSGEEAVFSERLLAAASINNH